MTDVIKLTLPEGMVINASLFERDQFNDKAEPSYKIEIAYDDDVLVEAGVYDALYDAANGKWGAGTEDEESLILGVLDGDMLATKREAKGKAGDAYKGKTVIRTNTIFSLHGVKGPGGIDVYDPDNERIDVTRQSEIYPGCFARAAVTIGFYEDNDTGAHAMKFYLVAVQKTSDGDALFSGSDTSKLFAPAEKTTTKRQRKG
jgi:hypothetical protein